MNGRGYFVLSLIDAPRLVDSSGMNILRNALLLNRDLHPTRFRDLEVSPIRPLDRCSWRARSRADVSQPTAVLLYSLTFVTFMQFKSNVRAAFRKGKYCVNGYVLSAGDILLSFSTDFKTTQLTLPNMAAVMCKNCSEPACTRDTST